jgi:hypothetical protein
MTPERVTCSVPFILICKDPLTYLKRYKIELHHALLPFRAKVIFPRTTTWKQQQQHTHFLLIHIYNDY